MKMKLKSRAIEEEEYYNDNNGVSSEEEEEEDEVIVGQIPTVSVPRHIKKRALKNKALSVSFSEKDLQDFVGGFHKRKKKRRKEAERQLKEKDRLKRIAARKRRKEEKELALYGGVLNDPSAPELEPDEPGSDGGGEDPLTAAPISETKTYESDFTTITVTTCDLSREEEDMMPVRTIPTNIRIPEKNHSLPAKKNPFKNVRRKKSQKKDKKSTSGKKDRKKGTGRR